MKGLKSIAVGALAMVMMVGVANAAAVKPGNPVKGDDTTANAEIVALGTGSAGGLNATDLNVVGSYAEDGTQTWDTTTITIKNTLNLNEEVKGSTGTSSEGRPEGYAWIGFGVTKSGEIADDTVYRVDEVDASGKVLQNGKTHTYYAAVSSTHLSSWVSVSIAQLEEAFKANTVITRYFKINWNVDSTNAEKPQYSQLVKVVIDPTKVNVTPLDKEAQKWDADYREEIIKELAFGKKDETTTPGDETTSDEENKPIDEVNPSETTPNAPESTKPVEDVKNPNTGDNFGTLVSMVSASAAGLFVTIKKTILG